MVGVRLTKTDISAEGDEATKLPYQKDFLRRQIIPSCSVTAVPSQGSECGVCLEAFIETTQLTEGVVFLPCHHFFHKSCIITWHTSIRPERDTCPLCRKVLFIADPLNPTQLRRLHEAQDNDIDMRPDASQSRSVWVNGEYFSIDKIAQALVHREFERIHASGPGYKLDWFRVFREIHNEMLRVNGAVRPVFAPYRDSFVFVMLAVAMLLALHHEDSEIERRTRAFWKFRDHLFKIMDDLGEFQTLTLHLEMARNGLFIAPPLPLVAVPLAYLDTAHIDFAEVSNVLTTYFAYRFRTGTVSWLHRVVDRAVKRFKASGRR